MILAISASDMRERELIQDWSLKMMLIVVCDQQKKVREMKEMEGMEWTVMYKLQLHDPILALDTYQKLLLLSKNENVTSGHE